MQASEMFAAMVDERGRALRALPYDQLLLLADEPLDEITIGWRHGQIGIIVEQREPDSLFVVVQGFIEVFPWWRGIKSVSLDGFHMRRDGTITELRPEEFYGYD